MNSPREIEEYIKKLTADKNSALNKSYETYCKTYDSLVDNYNKVILDEFNSGKIKYYVRERIPNYVDLGRDFYKFRSIKEFVDYRTDAWKGNNLFAGSSFILENCDFMPHSTYSHIIKIRLKKPNGIDSQISEMFIGVLVGEYSIGRSVLTERKGNQLQKKL